MKNVRDILRSKPSAYVYSVRPDSKVLDAIKLMSEKGVGALLVTENDKVVGVISERDYARKVVLMARSSHQAEVREIMTADVISVDPTQSMESCMELMTEKRIRHLPVIENDELIGMISIGDLVKNIISDQKFMIEQLQQYIRGETA
ncbi:CBS domain protein [gamma proteobacterium HdN1]|nr:CBS domain protein [gamma proteobacterium HdN1]